jgi:hypothetical protein
VVEGKTMLSLLNSNLSLLMKCDGDLCVLSRVCKKTVTNIGCTIWFISLNKCMVSIVFHNISNRMKFCFARGC